MANEIKTYDAIRNYAEDGKAAFASQIYDEHLKKFQQDINGVVDNGFVYDISAAHNNTKYTDLSDALGTNGANINQSLRKGGMSIKFVQTSDNKYKQYRCIADSFTIDIVMWQSENVDDTPTEGSNNLITSDGVARKTRGINQAYVGYEDDIVFETDNGEKIAKVDESGIHSKDYLYEKDGEEQSVLDDIEELKNDSLHHDHYSTDEDSIEVKSNSNETVAKFDNEGIKAKSFKNLDGTPIDIKGNKVAKAVILDTDYGGDKDDMNALTCLLWAERQGLVNIIGINCPFPRNGKAIYNGEDVIYSAISAMDAQCSYFGVKDMAFGINTNFNRATSLYCPVIDTYPHTLKDNGDADIDFVFYRRALSSLPDGVKCDICTIGNLSSISRLLNSSADTISTKTGLQLINDKVDKIFVMGGEYPICHGRESNFGGSISENIQHTYNVLTNCPRPMYFVGVDKSGIHQGDILWDNNMTGYMLYKAMYNYMNTNFIAAQSAGTLPSGVTTLEQYWKYYDVALDQTAVMAMCISADCINGEITGYDWVRGTNTIDNNPDSPTFGYNTFTPSSDGNHYYMTVNPNHNTIVNNRYKFFTDKLDAILIDDCWDKNGVPNRRLSRLEKQRTTIVNGTVKHNTDMGLVIGSNVNHGDMLVVTATPNNNNIGMCNFVLFSGRTILGSYNFIDGTVYGDAIYINENVTSFKLFIADDTQDDGLTMKIDRVRTI